MPRVKPEFKSKQCIEAAQSLKDLRYKHLGQQVTFLENALSKIEGNDAGEPNTARRTKSIRRIVAKMLKGQGIEHPAVDLLIEAQGRHTTSESAAATEQD